MAEHKLEQQWTPELLDFHKELGDKQMGPLWASVFSSSEPRPRAVPYLWKKELILEMLEKAKELLQVGVGSIYRRAVYLINPGMKHLEPHGWGGATQTLYAAVQALNPGESTTSNRGTMSLHQSGAGTITLTKAMRLYSGWTAWIFHLHQR